MSAKQYPSKPFPRDDSYYSSLAEKYHSIFRLIIANEQFQDDIKRLRNTYKHEIDELTKDFTSTPYIPRSPHSKASANDSKSEISESFEAELKNIASNIHFEGNMYHLAKNYTIYDDEVLHLLHVPRKQMVPSIEIDASGVRHVNIKLYGPVVAKDIEAWWSDIKPLIDEMSPSSTSKTPQHADSMYLDWFIYELNEYGLSNADIAETLNANLIKVYTYQDIGRRRTRLKDKINKSYR